MNVVRHAYLKKDILNVLKAAAFLNNRSGNSEEYKRGYNDSLVWFALALGLEDCIENDERIKIVRGG